MKQAAVFDSGLMLVVGEICEVMIGGLTIEVPLESLRVMLKDTPLETEGVVHLRVWNNPEAGDGLTVFRNNSGFIFDLKGESGNSRVGVIHRNEAMDLKDLVFPSYTYPAGFDFPPEAEIAT